MGKVKDYFYEEICAEQERIEAGCGCGDGCDGCDDEDCSCEECDEANEGD